MTCVNPKLLNGLLICLAVVNCIVVVIFELQRKPHVERHDYFITTNHVIVVTNYIAAVSDSPSSTNALNELVKPSMSVRYKYQYFTHGGRQFALVPGNEFLSRGSPTSYGRIKEIYPDRIMLDNGVWLVNDILSGSDVHRNENRIEVTNDRVRNQFTDL